MRTQSFDRRSILKLSLGGGAAAFFAAPAFAADKVDYGVASIDPMYSQIYVALKKGFFDKSVIEVSHVDVQSGPRSKQLLAAGQTIATTSAASDSPALTIAGKQSVLVYGFDERVPFANIMVNKELYDGGVNTVAKLTGRSLGVTAPQSGTWLMAVALTEGVGLKDKVAIRPLGDLTTMMGAVKTKGVDACMATYAMLQKGKEEGWGVPLFDISDGAAWNKTFGGPLPGVGTYVLASTIQSKPQVVQALVNGLCQATDFVHANSAETTVDLIMKDYLQGYTREFAISAIDYFKKVWSRDNLITAENYERLTKLMGGGRMYSDTEIVGAAYDKNVDMTFVKKARGIK